MSDPKDLAERIRDWDDAIEESDDQSNARDPFDGGVMLAVADLFEAYDAPERKSTALDDAMSKLRETVEQVIA